MKKNNNTQTTTGNHQYVVGVDPGSVKTGLAVWCTGLRRIIICDEFDSHCSALFFCHNLHVKHPEMNWHYVIEDARMSKLPPHLCKQGRAQGAGYVKALSKDWEEFCKMERVGYTLKSPQSNKFKKMDNNLFFRMTGIQTKVGESHMRDAAMLVYDWNCAKTRQFVAGL